jgi:predicted RNA binding protein YcfA (HicA-like mRNA interferase family)
MQWTYEIRGSHPQYKIPEVGGGRIANRLSKDVVKTMKAKQAVKKNFLRDNLRTSQYEKKSPKKTDPMGAGSVA